jgi:hypothetical protein
MSRTLHPLTLIRDDGSNSISNSVFDIFENSNSFFEDTLESTLNIKEKIDSIKNQSFTRKNQLMIPLF